MVKISCPRCKCLMPYFQNIDKFKCLNCGNEKPGSYFYERTTVKKKRRYYDEDF